MYGLVFGALWRRRGQSLLLVLLAMVAAAGAAGAPSYVHASVEELAAAAVGVASTPERVVIASEKADLSSDLAGQLDQLAGKVRAAMPLPGFQPVVGVSAEAVVAGVSGRLDFRAGVCDHLAIEGACPSVAGEVVIDEALARARSLRVGDQISVVASGVEPTGRRVRVVGIARPLDPREPYWGWPAQRGQAGGGERRGDDVVFTPAATFAAVGVDRGSTRIDLVATPDALRQTDPGVLANAVAVGAQHLAGDGIAVSSELGNLANRIFYDQQLVYTGVTVGVGELLLVSWFALFLAVAQTANERRVDAGLLKMRGARRRDLWLLLAGQSALPILLGAAAGWLVGPWLARWAVGPVAEAAMRRQALVEAAVATAIALLGALIVALIAEWRMLGQSVAALGRVVPSRRGWRGRVLDGVVVAVAAAGAYQIQSGVGGGQRLRGLALVTPLLIALAIGVLVARAVPILAGRLGRQAVRAGRLGPGLAGLHLARRPGQTAVIVLMVVVVSTLAGTALSWSLSDQARAERATAEVGADRVLTVRSTSPEQLLAAVRAADPGGKQAMAVMQTDGLAGTVLAVDTPRLESVAPWLPGYGLPQWHDVAAALRPAPVNTVQLTGARVAADVTWAPAATVPAQATLRLDISYADAAGTRGHASLGALAPGRHTLSAALANCSEGCLLVGLTIAATEGEPFDATGSVLTLHSLPGLDDQTRLRDRTQWRASIQPGAQVPSLRADAAGLTIGVDPTTQVGGRLLDVSVYPVAALTPIPVVQTPLGISLVASDPRIDLLDRTPLPIRQVDTATTLPRIGRGSLVDLEYASLAALGSVGGTTQVWLAPGAGPEVVGRLRDAGLVITTQESSAQRRAQLQTQGTALALVFLLVLGGVCVLLTAVSLAVTASAERRARGEEFAALRRQGLRPSAVRAAVGGGYAAQVGLALLIGGVGAAVLAAWVPAPLPLFGDDWHTLAPPPPSRLVIPLTALSLLMVLGAVASAAAIVLITSVRRRIGGAS